LTCEDTNGNEVTVRTSILYNNNKEIVKQAEFVSKTINVIGTVDVYTGDNEDLDPIYQIHVFFYKDITIL